MNIEEIKKALYNGEVSEDGISKLEANGMLTEKRLRGATVEQLNQIAGLNLGDAMGVKEVFSSEQTNISMAVTMETGQPGTEQQAKEPAQQQGRRFTRLRSATSDATEITYDMTAIAKFAELVPVIGIELAGLADTLADLVKRSSRGLAFVDDVLAENIVNWQLVRDQGGQLLVTDPTGTIHTLQIIPPAKRTETVLEVLTLLYNRKFDQILVEAARYYRSGAITKLMEESGSHVVSDTEHMVSPDQLRRKVELFLADITRMMEQKMIAPVVNKLADEADKVIIEAYQNRGVISSFGFSVGPQEDPFNIFINDSSGKYKRQVKGLDFFITLTEALTCLSEYSRKNDFATFISKLGRCGEAYAIALAEFAACSPNSPNIQTGQLIGIESAFIALRGFLEVNVSVTTGGGSGQQATTTVDVTVSSGNMTHQQKHDAVVQYAIIGGLTLKKEWRNSLIPEGRCDSILSSGSLIRECESTIRYSSDPLEKARMKRTIDEQWGYIKRDLTPFIV